MSNLTDLFKENYNQNIKFKHIPLVLEHVWPKDDKSKP